MSNDLETKAKVALDLLRQGAEEVEIVGTNLKVLRQNASGKLRSQNGGPIQIVNVHSEASARSDLKIGIQLSIVRQELRESYKNDSRLHLLEKRIDSLEKELNKSNPDKKQVKKILRWLMDFGWEAFKRIVPIVLDKL